MEEASRIYLCTKSSFSNEQKQFCSKVVVFVWAYCDVKLFCLIHFPAKYTPQGSIEDLFPGTWYLTYVDEMQRRQYNRSSVSQQQAVDSQQIIQVIQPINSS